MTSLPTLFSRTSTGKIQTWTIEVHEAQFRTTSGFVDGKQTTTEWTTCEKKNIGKANEKSPEAQALIEAWAAHQKKERKGGRRTIEELASLDTFDFMKADKYGPKRQPGFPVLSQPKLDGIRCGIFTNKNMSRGKKTFMTIPHVERAMQNLREQFPKVIFDGELYNHIFRENFNEITSHVKKTKPQPRDLAASEEFVEYHIYDCFHRDNPEMTFQERFAFLSEHITGLPGVVLVPTHRAETQEELDALYEQYMADKYEGQMIRVIDSPYEHKRSKHLLKRKVFQDAEYRIVGVKEGRGNKSGMAATFVCETGNGGTFDPTIKGPFDFLREIWENRDSYPGKVATVQFFNLTPDGIPRFPYAIKIREDFDLDKGK